MFSNKYNLSLLLAFSPFPSSPLQTHCKAASHPGAAVQDVRVSSGELAKPPAMQGKKKRNLWPNYFFSSRKMRNSLWTPHQLSFIPTAISGQEETQKP